MYSPVSGSIFGMRGVRLAAELAAKGVVIVDRLERQRVHVNRRTVLLEHQQLAVMQEQLGVGGAAAQALRRSGRR
jgi:hypothetical protein